MSILRSFFEPEKRAIQTSLPPPSGSSTQAGVRVTPERSLQITTVYRCVTLITEAVANLPVAIFRRRRAGERGQEVPDHPQGTLVGDRPNDDMDSAEMWRLILAWQLLRGNGYDYIEINGAGQAVGLHPIAPTKVEVRRTTKGPLGYVVTLDHDDYVPGIRPNTPTAVPANRMLHYRAFGLGPEGLSPIALARQGIGISFAAESYGARFFGEGAWPGGVLETDEVLDDETFERVVEGWRRSHRGWQRSHEPAIMEGGLTWKSVGLPPQDAQFLETRKFEVVEIARLFGVPPHLVGDVERSTSWGTGLEEQVIGFVRFTLLPWIIRLERVTRKILGPGEYLKFNADGLLRGDLKSRYEAYAIGRQWGWRSANDILGLEDEDPIPNGDTYLQPLAYVEAGSSGIRGRQRRQRMAHVRAIVTQSRDRHVDLHREILERYFEAQRDAFTAALEDPDAPEVDWDAELASRLRPAGVQTAEAGAEDVAELYGVEAADQEALLPWITTNASVAAEAINRATAERLAEATAEARGRDRTPEVRQELAEIISGVFGELIGGVAAAYAVARTTTTYNFGGHETARQAGLGQKTWRTTSGNPRSSHASIDGETVPMGQLFSNGGRWPGDPALPASEVANCSCIVEFS